jgi:hypothetical protein
MARNANEREREKLFNIKRENRMTETMCITFLVFLSNK